MNTAALIAQLRRHEGVQLTPYTDSVGKLTIGVGRNLTDVGISAEEAGVLLANDIERVRTSLDQRLSWWQSLDEVRQLVLADMAFNLGTPRLLAFTRFLEALQGRDYNRAADEMLASRWAGQVGQRALTLAQMMRTGRAA